MPRYIDADALIKKIFPYEVIDTGSYSINAKSIYEAIKKAPTADVVEVVRCSGCNYFLPCESGDEGYCIQMMRGMPNNGFCNYGKKEES